jgi:chemotaxis protein MotB
MLGAMPVTISFKSSLIAVPVLSALLLTGCVSKSSYDELQAKNAQLEQQVAAQQSQIAAAKAQNTRLVGAIKYTVNSDLLFPPGGYEMSPRGQDVIGKLAKKLAPTQQNKLVVNGYTDDTPIGPALAAQGITSNQILSQKRAENVMAFLISKGVAPDLVSAQGFGDANPIASNKTSSGRAKNRRVELGLAGTAG